MKSNLSILASTLREALAKDAPDTFGETSLGRVQQILSAAMGHNTLAARQAAIRDLRAGDHIIIDNETLNKRLAEFECPPTASDVVVRNLIRAC